ncbi:carbohydrate esterase family 16 protein [Hyaloscypha bicolor E]|uniref:Carbohydrate esterase family 16 protein n=1 Tax=Hyaloscypha bicolor E TaxID=1095630 RepID=A0A2J6TM81_9HELO|nr:carbohydrate esterase family 16 protein [Hyaloscypha bicolor E]PMD64126.1 carbohydrate esterase family 16 protein [Hyaloscypha bicolor E]
MYLIIYKPKAYNINIGDSYSSSSFSISGTKSSASNPIGNPAQSMFDFKTLPEVLTTQLNTSLTLTYDLASAGATAIYTLVRRVRKALDQESPTTVTHPTYAPWTAESSLFAVWLGVNDVSDTYSQSGEDAWINRDLDNYFPVSCPCTRVEHESLLFLASPASLPYPLCCPKEHAYSCVMPTRIAAFKPANLEANDALVDTQTAFNTTISSPSGYGAPDAPCFNSDGKYCLRWNNYHPQAAIH